MSDGFVGDDVLLGIEVEVRLCGSLHGRGCIENGIGDRTQCAKDASCKQNGWSLSFVCVCLPGHSRKKKPMMRRSATALWKSVS